MGLNQERDITLCVLIASGYERADTPAIQSERLELLLSSIRSRHSSYRFPIETRIVVSDDYSHNKKAQQDCSNVCEKFGADYILSPRWIGPCGNYNHAVRNCNTEYIAMLGDDQFCTPGWWDYMMYFIEHNSELKWGMLGWSVVFVEDLIRVGYYNDRREFYTRPDRLWVYDYNQLPKEAIDRRWCNWDRPRFRGCCSGTAFIIKKSLWTRFGGFFEELYQFDEDYGDNVWNITDHYCVQVPTPPILHYGGACEWPPEKGPADERWRKAWEIRPFVPTKFEDRGKKAVQIIAQVGDILKDSNYKPLIYAPYGNEGNLILDLGCGKNKRHPEAIGLDIVGRPVTDADMVWNGGFDRIPFPDNSCKLIMAHDFIEHVPHSVWISENGSVKRLQPTVYLFNEVYRVLRNEGLFEIGVPVEDTARFQDPTHSSVWNYKSFDYFSNTYEGFKDAYGHKSNFKLLRRDMDGQHLQVLLQVVK
jgi:predicted SAM-dependent methyltransferase